MFSWEAFATLTAVIAAGWVGLNQVKIQRRQTILVENDLKIQLLDKRTECVKSMREIHSAWITEKQLTHQERAKFRALFQEAELLYPSNVVRKIEEVMAGVSLAEISHNLSYHYEDIGELDVADEHSDRAVAQEKALFEAMPKLIQILVTNTRVDAWE